MLPNYAKWYSFSPPRWPNFPPPLTAAPGWASYEDEPARMLAFRPENCKGVARAWGRLLEYRRGALPEELLEVMGRYVPSASDLEELERDQVERARMRREDAYKREEEQKRMQREETGRRERAGRKREEEQQMWAELNKLIMDATGR